MHLSRTSLARAAGLAVAGALLALPSVACAGTTVTASETVNAGSLSFINGTPAGITFPTVTLNGTASQTVTQTQAFDVDDATGSGAGWKITATSTTLKTSGGATLAAPAIATTPSDLCDSVGNCTAATVNASDVTYPYYIPSGSPAPAATEMYDASTGTGLGAQTVTPTWTLVVPENASAGSYSSTWTLTLASAP